MDRNTAHLHRVRMKDVSPPQRRSSGRERASHRLLGLQRLPLRESGRLLGTPWATGALSRLKRIHSRLQLETESETQASDLIGELNRNLQCTGRHPANWTTPARAAKHPLTLVSTYWCQPCFYCCALIAATTGKVFKWVWSQYKEPLQNIIKAPVIPLKKKRRGLTLVLLSQILSAKPKWIGCYTNLFPHWTNIYWTPPKGI